MHNATRDPGTEYIVLDDGGFAVPCTDMSIEDLMRTATMATTIRPVRAGKITAPMIKFTELLSALHSAQGSDQFDFLRNMIQRSLGEIHQSLQLRILAGCSPDESTVFVAFVKPWINDCLVEANVAE